jgi:hypothetical protein
MKFICSVQLGPGAVRSLNEVEMRELDASSFAYDEELARRGHFVTTEALRSARSTALFKVSEGQTITTDGGSTKCRSNPGSSDVRHAAVDDPKPERFVETDGRRIRSSDVEPETVDAIVLESPRRSEHESSPNADAVSRMNEDVVDVARRPSRDRRLDEGDGEAR